MFSRILLALPLLFAGSLLAQESGSVDKLSDAAKDDAAHEWKFDYSVNLLGSIGTSDATDDELSSLMGGAHDPKRRGLNLQQLEIGGWGTSTPITSGGAFMEGKFFAVFTEDEVELEEAVASFVGLAEGLRIDFGYLMTDFGQLNKYHPHAWAWSDQNIFQTRILGSEGMRGIGLAFKQEFMQEDSYRLRFSLGVQDAFGSAMSSFGGELAHEHGHEGEEEEEERTVGGRPQIERERSSLKDFVWTGRAHFEFVAASDLDIGFGTSLAYGANRSGLDEQTLLFGVDTRATIYGSDAGERSILADFQAGFGLRAFQAGAFADEGDPLDPGDDVAAQRETLKDYAAYVQARVWVASDWALGLRFDWANGSGFTYHDEDREFEPADSDPLRDTRVRISPMVQWSPIDALRVRFHVNFDQADHLTDDDPIGAWLSVDYTFGTKERAAH